MLTDPPPAGAPRLLPTREPRPLCTLMHAQDPSTLTGPRELPVTALDLHATPGSAELITTLGGEAAQSALSMVPRPAGISLAPEAARAVPLTSDVHGERVV
jgi:hypothetical protein